MDRYEIQKLRDLPIEGCGARLGLKIVRHKCLCPFHDDHHASMSMNVRKNTFRCFVCGAHGGTIDLTMKVLNKNFKEACQWLADKNNIILTEYKPAAPLGGTREGVPFDASRYLRFFEHPWLSDAARRFLYDERRLDPRVIRWCRLSSWRDRQGVEWLQIPYYSEDGQLIGIQNRNLCPSLLGKDGERLPRFRFPQGSDTKLYGLQILPLLKPQEPLYISEGCSDCWSLLSAGHKAIAIPSATLLKPQDLEPLKRLTHDLGTTFHMYPDNDRPGETLFQQLQKCLPGLVRHRLPSGCKDYSEYFKPAVSSL